MLRDIAKDCTEVIIYRRSGKVKKIALGILHLLDIVRMPGLLWIITVKTNFYS